MVKLDRWKLFVEKNEDALKVANDEEVGARKLLGLVKQINTSLN